MSKHSTCVGSMYTGTFAGFAYIPPPRSPGVVASFEDDGFQPTVSERFKHENAALEKGVSISLVELSQVQEDEEGVAQIRLTEARSDDQGVYIDVARIRPFVVITADGIVCELSLEFLLCLRDCEYCRVSHGDDDVWSLNTQ